MWTVNHLGFGREYYENTEIINGEFSVGYTRLKKHKKQNVNKKRGTEKVTCQN